MSDSNILDTEYVKTNRQTAMSPVKHHAHYCRCDRNMVYVGKKCDLCGRKPDKKKLRKESNAR
jgi:hypothetical protein